MPVGGVPRSRFQMPSNEAHGVPELLVQEPAALPQVAVQREQAPAPVLERFEVAPPPPTVSLLS